jgi:putative membrane protein
VYAKEPEQPVRDENPLRRKQHKNGDWSMEGYLFCLGASLFLPVSAFADAGDRECWYGWGRMMGPGFGGMFMWILLLVAVVLIVYSLVRASKGGGFGSPPHETPLDVLRKRYAKGEITKEKFDEMKKDLEG